MTKPLSVKREKQIRDLPATIRRHAWTAAEDAADAIRDLVAELDRLRTERPQDEPDLSGWSAAENAKFEELYGVQAAMRLRASNNRVWQIVHELRLEAVEAGLDPYQDPMAQRLAAALVQPEPDDAEDAAGARRCTACGRTTADGSESEAPGADWVCGNCHVAIAASHQTPASAAERMP